MAIEINGMAHVILTVSRFEVTREFYRRLLPEFGTCCPTAVSTRISGPEGAARIAFGNFDATPNALALQPNEGQEQ